MLLTFVPGLLLFAQFALGGPGPHEVSYGPPPLARLNSVVLGDPFAPIGRSTAWVGLLLGVTLVVLAVTGSVALRGCAKPNRRQSETDLRVAMCGLPFAFLAFLMILPDRAGGGWTHTWRAEPLPYVGLALACALLPAPRMLQRAAMTAATLGSLVAIGMMVWVQACEVPSAVGEFNEADALIGTHCTVAPVLGQFKLDPPNTAQLFYHPLFHLASRFELTSDRAVLFSYGARLPIYPVRFRPQIDPHRILYGWQPGQSDTHIYLIDPIAFEAATGIRGRLHLAVGHTRTERGQPVQCDPAVGHSRRVSTGLPQLRQAHGIIPTARTRRLCQTMIRDVPAISLPGFGSGR